MKIPLSILVSSLIFISAFVIKVSDQSFEKQANYGVIDWDNFGYYLYLPATFIYDDLKLQKKEQYEELQKKYKLSSTFYQAHKIHNGNHVIQYTSGMAIIYSPAFFAGHLWASLDSTYQTDGFSAPYQLAILVESFILLFIGLFYLRKLCLAFFDDRVSTVIILLICIGTNFLQIASVNISSPHALLFSAYAFLLYFTHQWHHNPKFKYLLSVSIVLAIMILSRPNELLFTLIPLFWIGGNFPSIKSKLIYFYQHPLELLGAALPFALLGILQPLYWKYTTGEWIFDTYINEDFKLLSPYLNEYLFSFKKGWLLYTPLMIFGLLGFIPFIQKRRSLAILFLTFTILYVWILSSWDCWWYADSFSQRSIVQSYPIFALPFGYLIMYIKNAKPSIKYSVSLLLITLFLFNLFQTYQFKKGIIDASRMTKAYYLSTFLDTKPDAKKKRLLEPLRNINYIPEHESLSRFIIHKESYSKLNNDLDTLDSLKFINEGSLILGKGKSYSNAIAFPLSKYCDTSYAYFVARIRYRSNYPAHENPFGIVGLTKDSKSGKTYKYKYKGVDQIDWFEAGSWSSMDMLFIPPYFRNENDSLFFYVYHSGDKAVEIDQFYLEILDPSSSPKLKTNAFFNDYHTIRDEKWSQTKKFFSSKSYEQIDSTYPFSSTLRVPANQFKNKTLFFEVSGLAINNQLNEVYAVVSIDNKNGENIYYKSKRIDNQIEWEVQVFDFEIPNNITPEDTLKSYLWSKSTPYLIRSLTIREK